MRGRVMMKVFSPNGSGQLSVLSSRTRAAGLSLLSLAMGTVTTPPPGRMRSICAPQLSRARFLARLASASAGSCPKTWPKQKRIIPAKAVTLPVWLGMVGKCLIRHSARAKIGPRRALRVPSPGIGPFPSHRARRNSHVCEINESWRKACLANRLRARSPRCLSLGSAQCWSRPRAFSSRALSSGRSVAFLPASRNSCARGSFAAARQIP